MIGESREEKRGEGGGRIESRGIFCYSLSPPPTSHPRNNSKGTYWIYALPTGFLSLSPSNVQWCLNTPVSGRIFLPERFSVRQIRILPLSNLSLLEQELHGSRIRATAMQKTWYVRVCAAVVLTRLWCAHIQHPPTPTHPPTRNCFSEPDVTGVSWLGMYRL